MDLLQQTLQFCKQHDIKPARSKGQNFLINEDVYNKIIEVSDLTKDDLVLEVGSGFGFLTEKLAKVVKHVIAVELDDKLAKILPERLVDEKIKNVEVINKSILDFNESAEMKKDRYKIIANLPYNITSIFLRKFLSSTNKPELMVLMLQKEVAERIIAQPPKMSVLAASVQYYADAEIIQHVSRQDFYPAPDVDSAIIKIKPRQDKISTADEKKFFQLVKIGFSSKRKMLKNNLASGLHISQEEAGELIKKAGFSEKIRAQELSVDNWKKLVSRQSTVVSSWISFFEI